MLSLCIFISFFSYMHYFLGRLGYDQGVFSSLWEGNVLNALFSFGVEYALPVLARREVTVSKSLWKGENFLHFEAGG